MAANLEGAGVVDRTVPPLLDVADLTKIFSQGGGSVHALAGVSTVIFPGETLGLVGESGCGKTTFARTLLGIVEATSGSVALDGRVLAPGLSKRTGEDVRALQIVFQNPDSALNRRHTVRRILRRSLKRLAGVTGKAADERIRILSEAVRLPDRAILQRPAQLSGGQKQRVAIARAFAGEPRLVVCDEPTSALDVSVQAAILNLLVELQAERDTAYLFISHDLGVVRYLSDRIAVLYLGRLMELGTAETVFSGPHHPYTEALLSAVPTIDGEQRERIRLAGDIPSAADPPSGCVFHTRCPRKIGAICETQEPPLAEVEPAHYMRCHIPIAELRELQLTRPAGRTAAAGGPGPGRGRRGPRSLTRPARRPLRAAAAPARELRDQRVHARPRGGRRLGRPVRGGGLVVAARLPDLVLERLRPGLCEALVRALPGHAERRADLAPGVGLHRGAHGLGLPRREIAADAPMAASARNGSRATAARSWSSSSRRVFSMASILVNIG